MCILPQFLKIYFSSKSSKFGSIHLMRKEVLSGNSLAVQWLGLGAFSAEARVQSPVGELRSHKQHCAAKKKKKKYFQELLTSV